LTDLIAEACPYREILQRFRLSAETQIPEVAERFVALAGDLLDPDVKTQIEAVDADPVQWHFDDRFGTR
jgi:hypothetical protein